MPDHSTKRVGVIGIPGAWSSEILCRHVTERSCNSLVIPMDEIVLDLSREAAFYGEQNLCEYDALVIKKVSSSYSPTSLDRLSILSWIESRGVKTFSSAREIARLLNRLDCTLALQTAGIPMPPTCITENIAAAMDFIERSEEVVVKPLYSTKAQGMLVLRKNQALRDQLTDYQRNNPLLYLQKKIPIPGKDLGLMFLNGEYIGCYARNAAKGSWNTTIRAGGHYSEHTPRQQTIDIAQRAQSQFNLAFTTVDVVETDNDSETIVFEVSAFGGFKGAKEGLGIDVAALYADYILKQL